MGQGRGDEGGLGRLLARITRPVLSPQPLHLAHFRSPGNTDAYAFTVWLSSFEADLRLDEIGSPWPELEDLPGTSTTPPDLDHTPRWF